MSSTFTPIPFGCLNTLHSKPNSCFLSVNVLFLKSAPHQQRVATPTFQLLRSKPWRHPWLLSLSRPTSNPQPSVSLIFDLNPESKHISTTRLQYPPPSYHRLSVKFLQQTPNRSQVLLHSSFKTAAEIWFFKIQVRSFYSCAQNLSMLLKNIYIS